jgi:cholesterol oxidase
VKARNWRTKFVLAQLRKHLDSKDELTHVMPWFANGVDAADGHLYLGRRWLKPWEKRLKMKWDVRASAKLINRIIARHRELTDATGGEISVPITWRRPFRDLITPHPLGGCNMGPAALAERNVRILIEELDGKRA